MANFVRKLHNRVFHNKQNMTDSLQTLYDIRMPTLFQLYHIEYWPDQHRLALKSDSLVHLYS